MQRDGSNRSIWQDHAGPTYPAVSGGHYEVLIIGGGITGLTAALRLQERGKSCVVVDAHQIGFGTTGGTSAHLNTVLDTPYTEIIKQHGKDRAREVLQSARDAMAHIADNVNRYAISCDYTPCSGFLYATDDAERDELINIEGAIRELGIACEKVEEIPLPAGNTYAIKFAEQAHFHPTRYLLGLLDAYVKLGGHVIEGALVQEVTDEDHQLRVKIAGGETLSAGAVIYATHTTPGIQLMNFRVAPYRSYIQVWELAEHESYPHDLVYDMKEPFHYFRTVQQDGKFYLMVGGQDHKTAHHDNEQHNFFELEAFIKDIYSVKEKRYQWSSQFYESQDKLPFIGYYPGKSHQRELIATGFGGNGMIFGTLSGLMLTDLILTGDCRYRELYLPTRIGPLSGVRDLVVENVDVVKRFISDRFSLQKVEGLAELGRGEGRILKYDGNRIGVFKSEEGKIYAVDPVCRHAACIVKWNNTERSWDCPCHGARYGVDGVLLNGPSVAPLEKWDLETNERQSPEERTSVENTGKE